LLLTDDCTRPHPKLQWVVVLQTPGGCRSAQRSIAVPRRRPAAAARAKPGLAWAGRFRADSLDRRGWPAPVTSCCAVYWRGVGGPARPTIASTTTACARHVSPDSSVRNGNCGCFVCYLRSGDCDCLPRTHKLAEYKYSVCPDNHPESPIVYYAQDKTNCCRHNDFPLSR
jgi:hypothetical protein